MRSVLFVLLLHSLSSTLAQNTLTVKLNNKEWKPTSVSSGIEKVMEMTVFAINGEIEKEKFSITVDYDAIKGKKSATFTFAENFTAPPGGASISYAPKGYGRQQWLSAKGKLTLTEFNEQSNTASGTFDGVLSQMLDDQGGFILTSPRSTMKISGKFDKIKFRKVN